jgi:DNA invertase Pin-like site-specific DNA recombinase
LQIFGALAEFEKNIIRERTKAGLESARSRGRFDGRPKKLTTQKAEMVCQLYDSKTRTVKEISELVGVTRECIYYYLKNTHKYPT